MNIWGAGMVTRAVLIIGMAVVCCGEEQPNSKDSGSEEDSENDSDADSETETVVDTGTNTDSDSDSDINTDTYTDTETVYDTDTVTSADTGTDTDLSTSTDSDSDTESSTGIDTDTETETETESTPDLVQVCWVKSFGGTNHDHVHDIVVDSSGSILITGKYRSDITIGIDEINETTLPLIFENGEGYLSSFDSDGSLEWAKRVGATVGDSADGPLDDLARATDGGIVATGRFVGSAVLGEGEDNETILYAETETETPDVLIAKYDDNGLLEWARRDGKSDPPFGETGEAIIELDSGSIAVTGYFEGESIFGEGEINETILFQYLTGSRQQFISQYSESGNLNWAMADGGHEHGRRMALHQSGSFATCGTYRDGAVFGQGQPGETTLESPSGWGSFVSTFDTEGNLLWVADAVGEGGTYAWNVGVSMDESYLVSGTFVSGMIFNDELNPITLYGALEGFVARYTSDGGLIWAFATESSGGNIGSNRYNCIQTIPFPSGSFLLAATIQGTVNLGAYEPTEDCVLSVSGEWEPVVAKYNDEGCCEWCAYIGNDWMRGEAAAVDVLEDGSFYLAGIYEGSATFLTVEEEYVTIESVGETDGFIAHVCPQYE